MTGASAFAPSPRWTRVDARLAQCPGDTVIDVACGTGLNFAAIIDVDLSAEMLAIAQRRVEHAGWTQVEPWV